MNHQPPTTTIVAVAAASSLGEEREAWRGPLSFAVSEPCDLGTVSFHGGWTFHRATQWLGDAAPGPVPDGGLNPVMFSH